MSFVRRCFSTAALAIAFLAAPAFAQNTPPGSTGTMLTDLWWNPNESGWGVTITHQSDTLFLTFFIYKADRSPYWVTAQLTRSTSGTGITFPVTFTGDVYESSGPGFGAASFDPLTVTRNKVGTAVFTATNINSATLAYSINGTNVTKTVQRQALKLIDYTGGYFGGLFYQTSSCTPASLNGQLITNPGGLVVSQNGPSLAVVLQGTATTCNFNGTLSQAGQLGATSGTFACSDGTSGTFTMSGMQWSLFGFTAGLTGRSQTCQFDGAIGGVTGTHFNP